MSLGTQVLYEFDSFRLNPSDHSLLCAGKPVPLTPKSFDILLTLIERNGQLVTKDELKRKIWPDSFVAEANLTVNISALRKALGDTPEHQQYIETVPKLGYRFTSRVKTLSESLSSPARNGSRSTEAAHPSNEPAAARSLTPTSETGRKRVPLLLVLAILVAGLAAALSAYWLPRRTPAGTRVVSQPRRLAILPFRNIRQDA